MATMQKLSIMAVASAVLGLSLTAQPLMAAEGWQRLEHPTLDALFTNRVADFADFADYDGVYIEPVSVWYPNGSAAAVDTADALRNRAARAFESAFVANGLEVSDAPGRNTMIVRVQFIDFRATRVSEEALAWASNFEFAVQPGRVTMVAELIDARTGNTVMRMADMQDGPSSGRVDELQAAMMGWSDIVAAAVVSPIRGVRLANR